MRSGALKRSLQGLSQATPFLLNNACIGVVVVGGFFGKSVMLFPSK
jgi:hypothetical protein